jgi:hypothetical protein
MPIKDLLRRHPLPVLLALGISIISNSSFYILAYIPTYGVKTLHLPASTGFTATLVGGLVLTIGCPLAGLWSDKMARRPAIMVVTCWLFVLTSYPAFYLMVAWPSLAACIIAEREFARLVKRYGLDTLRLYCPDRGESTGQNERQHPQRCDAEGGRRNRCPRGRGYEPVEQCPEQQGLRGRNDGLRDEECAPG